MPPPERDVTRRGSRASATTIAIWVFVVVEAIVIGFALWTHRFR